VQAAKPREKTNQGDTVIRILHAFRSLAAVQAAKQRVEALSALLVGQDRDSVSLVDHFLILETSMGAEWRI